MILAHNIKITDMPCKLCDKKRHANGFCEYHYLREYRDKHKKHLNELNRKWRAKNPERVRATSLKKYHSNPDKAADSRLRRRYNITLIDYGKMLKKQNGVCALCGRLPLSGRRFAVDHNHKCCSGKGPTCGKCVRGLLCWICNRKIIGMIERWKVDPNRIVEYLA